MISIFISGDLFDGQQISVATDTLSTITDLKQSIAKLLPLPPTHCMRLFAHGRVLLDSHPLSKLPSHILCNISPTTSSSSHDTIPTPRGFDRLHHLPATEIQHLRTQFHSTFTNTPAQLQNEERWLGSVDTQESMLGEMFLGMLVGFFFNVVAVFWVVWGRGVGRMGRTGVFVGGAVNFMFGCARFVLFVF